MPGPDSLWFGYTETCSQSLCGCSTSLLTCRTQRGHGHYTQWAEFKAILLSLTNSPRNEPCYICTYFWTVASCLALWFALGKLQTCRLKTPPVWGCEVWKQITAADPTASASQVDVYGRGHSDETDWSQVGDRAFHCPDCHYCCLCLSL